MRISRWLFLGATRSSSTHDEEVSSVQSIIHEEIEFVKDLEVVTHAIAQTNIVAVEATASVQLLASYTELVQRVLAQIVTINAEVRSVDDMGEVAITALEKVMIRAGA